MNLRYPALALALCAALFTACGSDDDGGSGGGGQFDVTADITTNTTWTTGNSYTLKKHVAVLDGAVLTIQPGVTVLGGLGTSLIVTTSGRIEAVGTAAQPIVLTSDQPAGTRQAGDWGGVLLLGLAPINVVGGTAAAEGFPAGTANTTYGGNDPTHDCGTLKYVRIEFAGFALAPGNELNSLTMGGCGSQTEIDYVQVHRGQDDGVEMFGGTANLKHVVITQPVDDGLDWDFGWQGKAQFLVMQQAPQLGNNGIEADNNNPDFTLLPRSMPTIYNATFVGGGGAASGEGPQQGMLLRRGTAGHLYNFLVTNFEQAALDVDDSATDDQITSGDLTLQSSIFWDDGGSTTPGDLGTDPDADAYEAALYGATGANNQVVDPMIDASATNLSAPNFSVAAASPALVPANAATPPNDGFFDATATFVGAIGSGAGADWTAGWTAYPQN